MRRGRLRLAWFSFDDLRPFIVMIVQQVVTLVRLRLRALRSRSSTLPRRVATPSATRGPANVEPATNRSIGPKVAAAASPVKKRPCTEDSKSPESRGEPFNVASEPASSGESRPVERTSTR